MREWNRKSASLLHSLKQDSAFSIDFATNSKECANIRTYVAAYKN